MILNYVDILVNIMKEKMNKFEFSVTDDNGVITSVEFNSDTWVETFTHYLNLLRRSGFSISDDVKLWIPTHSISPNAFPDKKYLVFENYNTVDENGDCNCPKCREFYSKL